MIINLFDLTNKNRNLDSKFIEDKVIELLRDKGFLNFSEIAKELNIEKGDRQILLTVLQRMILDNKIRKEKIHITSEEGINLTSRFSLP